MTKSKFLKCLAMFMAVNMLYATILPTLSYALTSGPSQPEFSSFEPVATTNMVNDFTGDFTYNLPILEVPGPHGSSYPMSLSYHSGVTPEEEASWVGYGWTLNAGAINRSVRGIPDDFKNKAITHYNKMPKNWTATVGAKAAGELFSKDIIGANASASLRYNNYRGFGYNAGVGVSLGKGVLNMGYSVSDGNKSFSLSANPVAILNSFQELGKPQKTKMKQDQKIKAYKNAVGSKVLGNALGGVSTTLSNSSYGLFSYNEVAKSTQLHSYEGKSYNFSAGFLGTPTPFPAGISGNIFGSYSWQRNQEEQISNAYGYLYSSDANSNDDEQGNNMMDYHVEKESSFSKRDAFLGIPFNDADQYMVSGEGIGGGFRMYHKNIGHFGPRSVKSEIEILNVGGEIEAGLDFGGGVDLGSGNQTTELVDWNRHPSGSKFTVVGEEATKDEPVFFRFNNDLGGSWGDNYDETPFQAIPSSGAFSLTESTSFKYESNNGKRSKRSSYIGFNYNKDALSTGFNAGYKAYSKRQDLNSLATKNADGFEDYIGEFAIFNESGLRYVYGLPVYSRNEATLSYGIKGGTIENNSAVYFNSTEISQYFSDPEIKVGETKEDPYAASYLLTEITTPDYIDRSLDGPTVDDYGGYTRFNYDKAYGDGTWYKWRQPYNGLNYQKNSLSDKKDDLGTLNSGEKQVYYLQAVETKSHVAVFHTSSRTADAIGALSNSPAMTKGQKSSDYLKRLDKIELFPVSAFAKSGNGKLIRNGDGTISPISGAIPVKTVHFEYASAADELCKGAPNMASGRGKLTLKRIYFEYNGKSNVVGGTTRISPYQFEYKYPDFSQYPSKYKSGVDDVTINTINENPAYSPFASDAWGNYQPDGAQRHADLRTWIDQNEKDNQTFDPAAWQLKAIKLPSGGEIHVQYESDDYQYVQDQEAHVMATLQSANAAGNTFTVDLSAIGVILDPSNPAEYTKQIENIRDVIEERYVDSGKKIYFKFLYKLLDDSDPITLSSCNTDYISGYADVGAISSTGNELTITLGGTRLPKDVCDEFAKSQRLGMIDKSSDCSASAGALNDSGDGESVVRQLLGMVEGIVQPSSVCATMKENLSYLRIPTSIPKRGGGLRVKRLMTFDSGLESNPVLYGNEYDYRTQDDEGNVISSGVATNEPQTIREENILVDFVKRGKQSTWDKIIAGEDKKNQEGPIGESIYPGPSVGYSRVAIRSIHSGKTNTGFSVNEYHTVKDHPIIVRTTTVKDKTSFGFGFGGFVNTFLKKQWATQGFSFVLNNMHGQPKRVASYTGDYTDIVRLEKSAVVSEQVFEYYDPADQVDVMISPFGATEKRSIGREVDVTLAQKQVIEDMKDANVELDFSIGIFPLIVPVPIPFATAMPFLTTTEGGVSTHATSKVIRYPAIVKKTTTYQDGIYHVSEPLAFDASTGRPVATRSYDEFTGTYVSQEIKAGWEYKALRDKSSSENIFVEGSFTLNGHNLNMQSTDICNLTLFTPGDMVELNEGSGAVYHVRGVDFASQSLKLTPSQEMTFTPLTVNKVTVIHSGRINNLNASISQITRHDENTDLGLYQISESNRYDNSASFITALNNATSGISGEGSFKLLTPYDDVTNLSYEHLNMSAYADKLPACTTDWSDATIKNVEFAYYESNGAIRLQLMAFDIRCNGTFEEIVAEGWTRL